MFHLIVSILSVFVIFNGFEAAENNNKNIFCLYDRRSSERLNEGKFNVKNITDEYCTHLIYDYVKIESNGSVILMEEGNDRTGNIRIFNEKKHFNKKLKTIAMFGGWSTLTPAEYYSSIFKIEENQNAFVKTSIDFIIKHNFDGLALYWSWSGIIGGDIVEDKKNLVSILKKLKQELQKRNLLLVVACHADANIIEDSYNVKEISQNVDYIYLFTFNYFGSFSSHIGIAAGLYLHPDETNKALSVNSGISRWINLGASSEKLLMGIALAGRTFTLKYENQTEPNSPFITAGYKSQYISLPGKITYMELCQKLLDEPWTIKWEDTQKNPYAFKGNQWVGYDNEKSLEFKAKYVIEKNLGGVVIANTEDDDFAGFCGEKYRLHRILNTYLRPFVKSRKEYIVNISVFKRNLFDQSTQCVYYDSTSIPMEV